MKEITIKKNQTLAELINLVRDTFQLAEGSELRLRTYDPKLKIKMAVHDMLDF